MAKLKPNWELDEAVKAAKKTLKALEKYGKDLEPRLPAGITEGLAHDLTTVTGGKVARPAYNKTAKAKTRGERARAEDGADLLSRLRNSIKSCPEGTPEIQKAVGVGSHVNPGKTSSVAESLTALLEASRVYLNAFRAAGILDSDLTEARSILDSLLLADEDQQGAQDTQKELTAQKDAAQLRIEQAVSTVAATGQTHFRKQAAKRAVFEKLMPKSKGKGKNGDDEPPKPTVH